MPRWGWPFLTLTCLGIMALYYWALHFDDAVVQALLDRQARENHLLKEGGY
jgi:hypothetical protein